MPAKAPPALPVASDVYDAELIVTSSSKLGISVKSYDPTTAPLLFTVTSYVTVNVPFAFGIALTKLFS